MSMTQNATFLDSVLSKIKMKTQQAFGAIVEGNSELQIAARDNHHELLELLLTEPGVNVNIRDENNRTPLMYACRAGHIKIVRSLCQVTGLDINCRDRDGWTALHEAVRRNDLACLEILREVPRTDWNVITNSGGSALTMALLWGFPDILQLLLSVPPPRLDLRVTDPAGRNLAQIAVESEGGASAVRCVQLLSQNRRVNWNIKNREGDTPVMFCLKNNKIEMARILLSTPRVNLNTRDRQGKYLENIAREKNVFWDIIFLLCGVSDNQAYGRSMRDQVPECPVCFEQYSAETGVHQCGKGHFICGNCRSMVESCPTCRGRLMGKCHGFEEFLRNIF